MFCVPAAWSITARADDAQLSQYPQTQRARLAATAPSLPDGWSSRNHSGLDAATPPPDLEASLALSRYPRGSPSDSGQNSVILKYFIRGFGSEHTHAVTIFNLLACDPKQRPHYFECIAAFTACASSKYGGDAMFPGLGVSNWSSKDTEAKFNSTSR